jgi:hypothetical protein
MIIYLLSNFQYMFVEDQWTELYMKLCTDTEELFPVASATSFFTHMDYILKVMSIGNVRSACYHRLRFLEEVCFHKLLYTWFLYALLWHLFITSNWSLYRNSAFICYCMQIGSLLPRIVHHTETSTIFEKLTLTFIILHAWIRSISSASSSQS